MKSYLKNKNNFEITSYVSTTNSRKIKVHLYELFQENIKSINHQT